MLSCFLLNRAHLCQSLLPGHPYNGTSSNGDKTLKFLAANSRTIAELQHQRKDFPSSVTGWVIHHKGTKGLVNSPVIQVCCFAISIESSLLRKLDGLTFWSPRVVKANSIWVGMMSDQLVGT